MVERIAKLRICPVPEGKAPPFLTPPPSPPLANKPAVGFDPPNNTRLATLELAIMFVVCYIHISNINI